MYENKYTTQLPLSMVLKWLCSNTTEGYSLAIMQANKQTPRW